MAFISSLHTKRPNYWTLFKWVALIFLAPVMVLAIVPVVITALEGRPAISDVQKRVSDFMVLFVIGASAAGFTMIPIVRSRIIEIVTNHELRKRLRRIFIICVITLGVIAYNVVMSGNPLVRGVLTLSGGFLCTFLLLLVIVMAIIWAREKMGHHDQPHRLWHERNDRETSQE
jgi:hypothetical protein